MEYFSIDPGMLDLLDNSTEEELYSMGKLYENQEDDTDIELYIYINFLHFSKTGFPDCLNQAIQRTETWTKDLVPGHTDTSRRFDILDTLIARKFELEDSPGDAQHKLPDQVQSSDELDRQINLASLMLESEEYQDDPERTSYLGVLAVWLSERYDRTQLTSDLHRAIQCCNTAVEITPADQLEQTFFSQLLQTWINPFERTNSVEDLNIAISKATEAVKITPAGHPARVIYSSTLGSWLEGRFQLIGAMEDLDAAITEASRTVEGTPEDHPRRPTRMSNLSARLGTRFEHTASIKDLDLSIEIGEAALKAWPSEGPGQVGILNNLAIRYSNRFERTNAIVDIDLGVNTMEKALASAGEEARTVMSRNLARMLHKKWGKTQSQGDLDRSIEILEAAVAKKPPNIPLAGLLGSLAHTLRLRSQYNPQEKVKDLDRAVEAASRALEVSPPNYLWRADYLYTLGSSLAGRYCETESQSDLDWALSCYKEGWSCQNTPATLRIRAALSAATVASFDDWGSAAQILEGAVSLLPVLSPRALQDTDKQHTLADFAGLASTAAAAALNAGKGAYEALKLLESGRGVIASTLMDMRGDLSDLRDQHSDLADEFTLLRDKLDSAEQRGTNQTQQQTSWNIESSRRREADRELSDVIERIRAKPGFSDFLLPPAAETMMKAAEAGPIIVVNVASKRCDAFLIKRDGITPLPLTDLTEEEIETRARAVASTGRDATSLLEWLWDVIACPCLDALGFNSPVTDGDFRRVWWIPTGLLSQLPLHAAGRHTQGSSETVLDRVMSSYASSVKALVFGRRSHQSSTLSSSNNALLVAMRQTPGLRANRHLPFVADEEEVFKSSCPQLGLDPVIPKPVKEDVLQHLQSCRIFHFAGHGESHPTEPSQSSLLLEDWETNRLTVGDLRDRKFQENAPFLAFLSACSTGANHAEKLADEGIHLIGAFQLAGFRHVVGTLWEVSDRSCVHVARILYQTIQKEGMTDMAICLGLHRAVRALRSGGMDCIDGSRKGFSLGSEAVVKNKANTFWVPYVHFGG
jgi:tetratricopeptide (TPR) repeat protein